MTTKLTPARRKMHLLNDKTPDFTFLDEIKYQEALRALQTAEPKSLLAEIDSIVFNHIELPALFSMLGRAVKIGRKPAMKRAPKAEQFKLNLAA